MTEPLYFTIREQEYGSDAISREAERLHLTLTELNYKPEILQKYASQAIAEPFLQRWEHQFIVLLEKLPEGSFGKLNLQYIIEQIQEDNNNTIYFYTKNGKKIKNLQAFITYDVRYMDPWKKTQPFIYIHSFAINSGIDIADRRLSGANIFSWFYKNAINDGFYCIKIDALSSALYFWRNKSRFVYITDHMSELKKKNLETLDQLFIQRKAFETTPGKEMKLGKIAKSIKLTKEAIGQIPMKRTKLQDTPSPSPIQPEFENGSDTRIDWYSPSPTTSVHSQSWYSPESIASTLSHDSSIVSPAKMIHQLKKQYPMKRTRSFEKTQKTKKPNMRRTKSI